MRMNSEISWATELLRENTPDEPRTANLAPPAVTAPTRQVAEPQEALRPGQTPRAASRFSVAVQVGLTWTGGNARAFTLDLGAGGFSALLASQPPASGEIVTTLRLRHGDVVTALVGVAGVRRRSGSLRVSFVFQRLSDGDRKRLERYLGDQAGGILGARSGS